jgi:zinc transporter ZupT
VVQDIVEELLEAEIPEALPAAIAEAVLAAIAGAVLAVIVGATAEAAVKELLEENISEAVEEGDATGRMVYMAVKMIIPRIIMKQTRQKTMQEAVGARCWR